VRSVLPFAHLIELAEHSGCFFDMLHEPERMLSSLDLRRRMLQKLSTIRDPLKKVAELMGNVLELAALDHALGECTKGAACSPVALLARRAAARPASSMQLF
jgi:hypothetical protein